MAKRGKRQQSAAHRNWPGFGNGFKGAPNHAGRQAGKARCRYPKGLGHVASRCWSIETVQRARAVTLATNIIWQQFSCLSPLFFFSRSFALRFCFLLTRSYKFHSGKWFLLATDHTSRPVQTRPDHTHTHTHIAVLRRAETGRAASAQSHSASSLRVQLPPIAAQPPSRSGSKRLNLENWYVIGFKAQNKCVSWLLGRPFHL